MRVPFYKIGDNVEIVNYGHLKWENKNMPNQMSDLPTYSEEGFMRFVDILKNLVGQKGIVIDVKMSQGIPNYSISGIDGKSAWYQESQMSLIPNDKENVITVKTK